MFSLEFHRPGIHKQQILPVPSSRLHSGTWFHPAVPTHTCEGLSHIAMSAICRGIADSAQVIYPQSRSAAKEDLLFLYLVFHSRVLVVVNWSCSSGSKSFCAHYFIFNYVLKPLFSKLTLFWPGEWNKKKVDCKHNTEPKFGQLRAALYSPLKAMCCNKDPTYLHPCKAGQIPGECKCPQGGCSCLWG